MKKYLFLLILIILTSCSSETLDNVTTNEYHDPEASILKDSTDVYQGDILLLDELDLNKSTGRVEDLWTNKTVYYKISVSNPDRVLDAMNAWTSATGISFVERTTESNYVEFVSGSGCASYVGMIGGRQTVILADACTTGNTIHEIGHALGLWHEQSRSDRDKFIEVHFENVQAGRENNFYTYVEAGWDGADYSEELDFSSIMMYSAFSFSKNGEPTITKVDGSLYSTQRNYITDEDALGIRIMYDSFVNGEYYAIRGLRVLRNFDRFYYYSSIGWRQVELYHSNWGLRWRYVF